MLVTAVFVVLIMLMVAQMVVVLLVPGLQFVMMKFAIKIRTSE